MYFIMTLSELHCSSRNWKALKCLLDFFVALRLGHLNREMKGHTQIDSIQQGILYAQIMFPFVV